MDSRAEEIHLILDNLKDADPGVTHSALSMLVQKLRSSTSVASTLPKILIYLISQKDSLKERLESLSGENRRIMADILSVISATSDSIDALNYRVEGGSTSLDIWGHQYIKKLSSDLITYHQNLGSLPAQRLSEVLKEVLHCLFQFNSEYDAIDLLLEIDKLEELPAYTDSDNFDRVASYLVPLLAYLDQPVKMKAKSVLIDIYKKEKRTIEYTTLLIETKRIEEIQTALQTASPVDALQMACILSKHNLWLPVKDKHIQSVIYGHHMARLNKYVADQLGLTADKDRGLGSFPEALAKASFAHEAIPEHDNKKTYKISSQAAKGLLYLWDQQRAMVEVEENLFAEDGYVRAASILALAVSSCRTRDENETVLAATREALSSHSTTQRLVLLEALALQYTGTARLDVYDLVKPFMQADQPEVSLFAIYVAGSIFAGTADTEVLAESLQILVERPAAAPFAKFALLGIALLFFQIGDAVEPMLELLQTAGAHAISLSILSRALAYFATGSAQVLHSLLKNALEEGSPAESEEESPETIEYKDVFGILGIALVGSGDETLAQMATHILEGAVLLDSPRAQMAVPLALSLLHLSGAKPEVLETLKRCAHTGDASVIVASLAALGLAAAGTNNARAIAALEEMTSFCGKGAPGSTLRIAQGLIRLGKGAMKISLCNGQTPSVRSVAGVLGFVFALLDGGACILDRYYFTMMLISPGIVPKYVVTVDAAGEPIEARIRVGTRVDIAGVAGRPKRLAGAQVHSSPILLQATEAAEVLGETPTYHCTEEIVVIDTAKREADVS
ncbi:26S proteasome regulatory subunit N1 [Nematocida homosporus]|uniref:26S proteasome regulatory subunit N1 n=1 Tax=Nematocida homosporus TaxID=1912981 RepID=UPI00222021E1|nr:26S proteasome regulatory subunit N1 [Nematocida homosporus]KAI5184925.1 26S proteasome regulatory subunit N1 [Nematocida homosporus]